MELLFLNALVDLKYDAIQPPGTAGFTTSGCLWAQFIYSWSCMYFNPIIADRSKYDLKYTLNKAQQ